MQTGQDFTTLSLRYHYVLATIIRFSSELYHQEFHRKYVLVPADKAANHIVVVCRIHYINTLKQELNGTKAYKETSTDEKSVVYIHLNEIPIKFAVDVKEHQDRLPTMYWLPKLHKRPYI